MTKFYFILPLLTCVILITAVFSPRASADWFDISPLDAIQLGVIGIVTGAAFEDPREGVKSSYQKGSQQSIIEFELTEAQKFSGTLYLPMPSATFKIISANGLVIFDSHTTPVKSNQSLKDSPKHPWVLYFLPMLFSENNGGKWSLEVNYPIAHVAGDIYLDLRSALTFDAEIKTDPYHRVISDNLNAAVEVVNPSQLAEKIEVSMTITFPDNSQSQFIALDNGEGQDVKKSDALYSVNQAIKYQQVGLHVIEVNVDFYYFGKTYQVKKLKNIWVTEQLASIKQIRIITEAPQQTCIKGVRLEADLNLEVAGNYELIGSLKGTESRFYGNSHTRFYAPAGPHKVEIYYAKKELMSSFSKAEVISFKPLRLLKTDHENQHHVGYNAHLTKLTLIEDTFKLSDLHFCREEIEVDSRFLIEEKRSPEDGKISALQLIFNVSVNQPGIYGYTVNVRDGSNAGYATSIGGRYHEMALKAGENNVVIRIGASRLKQFKGGEIKARFSIWQKSKGERLDKKLTTTIKTYQSSDFSD